MLKSIDGRRLHVRENSMIAWLASDAGEIVIRPCSSYDAERGRLCCDWPNGAAYHEQFILWPASNCDALVRAIRQATETIRLFAIRALLQSRGLCRAATFGTAGDTLMMSENDYTDMP